MNRKDFLSAKQRQCEFRKWKPKEERVKTPKNRPSSDEFIAQGGKYTVGKSPLCDAIQCHKKAGFNMPSLY